MNVPISVQKPLGRRLLDAGLISNLQLDLALREQKRQGKMLGEILVELGFVNPDVLTGTLASENKTEVIELDGISIDDEVLLLIDYEIAKKHKLIAIDLAGEILTVALADAFDVVAIDIVEKITSKTVKVVTAHETSVLEAIEHNYSHGGSVNETVDLLLAEGITFDEELENISPMVRLVDQIIGYGVKNNAADIHLEPDERIVRVRYRIDGVLKTQILIPSELRPALTARLKLISGMNISEKRVPQDGRIHFKYGSKEIDLRISTLPTSYGESVVMRILDSGNVKLSIDWLGFSERDKSNFTNLMNQPFGMVLITGPTGSGKTTTLYTALGLIDTESKSVFTLEDPVEYSLPNIRQTPINTEVGMTFATGLKALLRQDPDVILIGEIRDLETAELAIRAALTGHLVLTTLHTNTAAGVIPRLIDMGIERYLLPPALMASIGQRLVRKLCEHCKQSMTNNNNLIEEYQLSDLLLESDVIFKPRGCIKCNQSGYKGRLAIYEIFNMTEEMHDPIIQGQSSDEIEAIAKKDGMTSMLQDGISKVKQGLTSVEEVMRLVK